MTGDALMNFVNNTLFPVLKGNNITDGCARVEAGVPPSEERDVILSFIRNSKRGIVRACDTREKGSDW